MQQFLSELKRRRVFRVAAAYVVVAFALLQAADIIFPALDFPSWTMRLVVVLAFLVFPAALVLAWAFDITPEGVVRTEDAAPTPSAEGGQRVLLRDGGRTRRWAGALVAAGGLVLLAGAGSAYLLREGRVPDRNPNRVAVDAFVNRTGDPALDAAGRMAADWLVDGLQQISGLEVVPAVSLGTPALALERTTHGHVPAAAQVLGRSVAWQRARPASEAGTPNARFRMGRDLLELGQTAEARRIFEALVQEAPEDLRYRADRGIAAARAGDRAAAAEAMSWLAILERPYLFGEHLYQQAQIAAELGEREQAVALLSDALARGRSLAPDPHRSPHLRSLRGYPPFEEMLRPKG